MRCLCRKELLLLGHSSGRCVVDWFTVLALGCVVEETVGIAGFAYKLESS
jgi:hypothetical protein